MKTIHFMMIACYLIVLACKKETPAEPLAPQKPQLPPPEYGTVTDIEGHVYKTVKIGAQWWMAENLRVSKLNDGTFIQLTIDPGTWSDPSNEQPMSCYYDNKGENFNKYGLLYNWYTVNTGKLAPTGWHVPNDADWTKLRDFMIANGYNYDGSTTDNKIAMALAANTDWTFYNDQAGIPGNNLASQNSSGFNALPAGNRDHQGAFYSLGTRANFWSSSVKPNEPTWNCTSWNQSNNNKDLFIVYDMKKVGYSVRCVKD